MRVFTVPSGVFSRSAISLCDRPSKYAISMARRCSCGSSASAVAHARGALAAHDGLVGPLGARALFALRDAAHLGAIARAAGAKMVDHEVAHQAQEPGARAAARGVVALGAPPDTQERFLHGVLRQVGAARDPQRETVGERRQTVVELRERGLVAARDLREEGDFDVGRVRQDRVLGPRLRPDDHDGATPICQRPRPRSRPRRAR